MKRFSLLIVLGISIALVNIGKVEASHLKAKVPSEAVKQYLADLAAGKKPEAPEELKAKVPSEAVKQYLADLAAGNKPAIPEEFKAQVVSDEFKEYYAALSK
ncbi:MAG: hypothetical protein A2889_03825 [Nitrospinae bacterium RIFCSPLOWO2_01_FULL_39_10]|nr:MAG: hypothetical protein A2889_03825 [Nitrospinae bacterium RIFCSPLOWO2_01_FULL_39_10]